jgi:hypothetical protein
MRSVWVLAGMGWMFAASACPVLAQVADADNPISAVWKEQRLNFFYKGQTSRYSCSALRDKVRAMLLDLGARRDLDVTALGCEQSTAQVRLATLGPSLSVVFSAPVLADAGVKPSRPGDLAAVDARFESFTLAVDVFRNMGAADCELVEDFARQILPKLVTRDLKQDITCVPFQQGGGRFLVRGEVLKSLPQR